MLCKMISCEERTLQNGNLFYVCRFVAQNGNSNAETFITLPNGIKVLNPEVASLRSLNLTKCLFPTEDANAQAYAQALHLFSQVCESESGTIDLNGKKLTKDNFNIALPLVYKSIKVAELTNGIEYVLYFDANGEEKKLYNFSVVGYSKINIKTDANGKAIDVEDTNTWDEQANGNNLDDYLKTQFENNLTNGTYTIPTVDAQRIEAEKNAVETAQQPINGLVF